MKRILKQHETLIIFSIYPILSLILVLNHELWIDEAQAWEIAKNLSIPEIFAQMRYEGHSCLWHLILVIPAKLGIPVISMNIISWIFVSLAVFLILKECNWGTLKKIILVFSPAFLYYLSAISRCYSLIPILLILFILLYDKRHTHPFLYVIIIGLLAHTHSVMYGFVAITSLLFLGEYITDFKNCNKK